MADTQVPYTLASDLTPAHHQEGWLDVDYVADEYTAEVLMNTNSIYNKSHGNPMIEYECQNPEVYMHFDTRRTIISALSPYSTGMNMFQNSDFHDAGVDYAWNIWTVKTHEMGYTIRYRITKKAWISQILA